MPSSTAFSLKTLDDGENPQDPSQSGDEAVSQNPNPTHCICLPIVLTHNAQTLDIQYTVGLATGVPTTFISVGNDFHDGDLNGEIRL